MDWTIPQGWDPGGEENKRQDGERRPRSPLPLPSSYLPPSLPHSLSGPTIVTTCFFFFTCRGQPVLPANQSPGSRGFKLRERLDSEPLTMVSRPMGAEKTHSSWKTTASAWWLASRSSKLLRRPSICGSGDADELYGWKAAVVREWGTQMSDSCYCWKLQHEVELFPKMWPIYFTRIKVLKENKALS